MVEANNDERRREGLGPAERIINTLLSHSDHMVHNRPGYVSSDRRTTVGVRWAPVTHKEENGQKIVYKLERGRRGNRRIRLGVLQPDNRIIENGNVVGEYRPAGLFPEIATWMYTQVAEVWKLDNEFAARWASYAYKQDHRDLKVILSAFLLVQSRRGDPVRDDGKVLFHDDDFRNVGEAMMLLYEKGTSHDLNPKLLLRIHDVLNIETIAKLNHELGFGRSDRHPFLGRWPKAVEKWLRYRENNPRMLDGLVRAGFRQTVSELARRVGYKPNGEKFFDTLRWKQKQAEDGRRTIAIGKAVGAAETLAGLPEANICQWIEQNRPSFKRLVGLIPPEIGLTRAIVSAAIENDAFSNKDLVIYSPTLEDLGLLDVQDIRERWEHALKQATDQRAANIASRMKSKDKQDKLQEASDEAAKAAVEEEIKGIRMYIIVDVSASMQGAIEAAKEYIVKFLPGIPLESMHVAIFNTSGREIRIQHASTAGVQQAFRGVRAGGGTDYGAGIRALQRYRPQEDEDVIVLAIGDEQQRGTFTAAVRESQLNPVAFGLIKVVNPAFFGGRYPDGGTTVQDTAAELGIPCLHINEAVFQDPYAVPRTLRNLIAATPVGQVRTGRVTAPRVSLIDQILNEPLLEKPVWA